MISQTEKLSFTGGPKGGPLPSARQDLDAFFRRVSLEYVRDNFDRFCAAPPTEEPFDWCVANVIFDDTEVKGPFNPIGREYLRDVINAIDDPDHREFTDIFATGSGKTLGVMCRHAWTIVHNPRRALMVMPATKGEGGAETYVTSRFIPCLDATKATRDLMPEGQRRLFMNSKKVRLNGAHFGYVGANSSAQIASNRCGLIELDELDKYKGKLGNEAGTKSLVGERTEGVTDYKIFQNTTPTVESAMGWKSLERSDFRRRFLPCPHCNSEARHRDLLAARSISEANLKGWFDLAWSEQYCVLPTKFDRPDATCLVPRAFIKWDDEAKRRDGEWDKDLIVRSVRLECPHCKGHIRDEHKVWMDKNGLWIPLKESRGHAGRHLSALYSPPLVKPEFDPIHKSLLAGRALKFLNAAEDGQGMKGFINSTLAEVDVAQEHSSINLTSNGANFATEDWTPLMTCDFQKLWPFIWFVIAKWSSFKLQPPFPITNGKPNFADSLDKNPTLKKQCETIVAGHDAAWIALAEVLRFDPRTGKFPMLDYLVAQKLTGAKLVEIFRDRCNLNTIDLGRFIYREMGLRMPKGGDSEVIAAGHCELSGDDAWNELREYQQQFAVGQPLRKFGLHPNRAVVVDSGYMEEHNPEVLRKCYESGEGGRFEWFDPITKKFCQFRLHQFCRPVPIDCWIPYKGYPIRQAGRWKSAGIQTSTHWAADDPFKGLGEAGKKTIAVLETASEHYFRRWLEKRAKQNEIREAIAAGKTHRGNIWNVAADCKFFGAQCARREDFERQLNSKGINSDGEIWERGSGGGGKRRHPDHLLDCASQMQEALAETLGFYSYERQTNNTGTK